MRIAALVGFGTVAVVVATAGLPGAGAAPVPQHLQKEPEGEKAKLQGKWRVESIQIGGKDVLGRPGQDFDILVEFRGAALAVTADIGIGGEQKTTATVKHNPAGAKQFTITDARTVDRNGKPIGNGAGPDVPFTYAFEGDKLFLAVSAGDGKSAVDPRKPDPSGVVIVLVRAK